MPHSHLHLLACPDCGGSLTSVGETPDALLCGACPMLFPVVDAIPILLPDTARNYEFEAPLIEALPTESEALQAAQRATMSLLEKFRGVKSWEWEDEEFWSRQYRERKDEVASGDESRGWPMRLWQREFLIDGLLEADSLANKTIVDIGCGGGNNFQVLIEPHCDSSTVYVAADVSLDGLRLNRLRNPHANALYVVCSADRLPFRPASADLICYFGILHHTERKAATITQNLPLLKPGGCVILHEALERPTGRPDFLPADVETSAHEETIERAQLDAVLAENPQLRVANVRYCHTLTMAVLKRLLVRFARGRKAFDIASALDVSSMHLLGWLVPQFKPAEVLMLLRKDAAAG